MKPILTFLRKIDYLRAALLMVAVLVALFFLFCFMMAYEENGEGHELLFWLSKFLFRLIAFPISVFQLFGKNDITALVASAIIGAVFYGLLIEAIIQRYRFNQD